ncbi:hypothetical protein ACNQKP_08565 [Bdellovibrio bacteriovorus]|uniref:hypothetical protein n=1 Tax=Bdellovibrio bacteriovorus TaxID=959 RepID=UPI003AA880F1
MNIQSVIGTLIFTVALSASTSFAVDNATESAGKTLGAKMVSEISFDEGKSSLTDSAKDDIRKMVNEAKQKGKIDELKVAVWADREYPTEGAKASKQDVNLANDRARVVKNFIKDELKVGSVNTYNMTERPNALQKFMHTDTAKTKTAMEDSGAAPRTQDETGFFNQKAKSSKAVIMVYMK